MKRFLVWALMIVASAAVSAQEVSILHPTILRSEPSPQGRVVAVLQPNTTVTILSGYARGGYLRVMKDGKAGWVVRWNLREPEAGMRMMARKPVGFPHRSEEKQVGDKKVYPQSDLTPGVADPSVTQDNLADNICNKNWSTSTVRPPTSVTNKIKVETMKAYGFTDAANHYELDHLISLQVGGCPDCVENLWPEAYGDPTHPMTQNERSQWNKAHPGSSEVLVGSLEKDLVENHIHDEVCVGIPNAKMSSYAKKYPAQKAVSLQRGQEILATEWYGCYLKMMDGNKPCE